MKDPKTLYQGVSCVAWGFFFEYFDFNINGISVLPAFVGYCLFWKAIGLLQEERRDLALLRPLGLLLIGWHLLAWLCTFAGYSLENGPDLLRMAGVVVSLADLYFHFQLLTDLAAMAADYQEDSSLDTRLLRLRTWQTVFLTLMTLLVYLRADGWWSGLTICMAIAGVVTGLCIMLNLFALRKLFTAVELPGD